MLSENSTVPVLRLSPTDMTNEGLNILAKGLCKYSTLETLTFVENVLGFKNESPSKFAGHG